MVELTYTLTVKHKVDTKVDEGKAFVASCRFESVSSDSSVQLLFLNPDGSPVIANLILLKIFATGKGLVDLYFDNSITEIGTRITPINMDRGSPNSSNMVVAHGGSYTLSDKVLPLVHPGGSGVRAIGTIAEIGERFKITPGKNIIVQFTNTSASDEDVSIMIEWWED